MVISDRWIIPIWVTESFDVIKHLRTLSGLKRKNYVHFWKQAAFQQPVLSARESHCLVFRKKDLYLVITQKLKILKSSRFHVDFMKSGGFHVDFMKSGGFHVDFMKSTWKPYKSNNSTKPLQFHGVQWEGYVSGFHEICWISQNLPDFKRPIARNDKAYVSNICMC